MRDYESILKQARTCALRKYCDIGGNCEYYDADVCCQGGEKDVLYDAADAIEELLAEKTKLENSGKLLVAAFDRLKEKVPKWISVEERLPEGNGTRYEYDLEESNLVLVYGINHIGEMAYGLGRYIYDHADPKDSGWNGNMDCDYDLDYCTVTHWMPLPEPPKEVE